MGAGVWARGPAAAVAGDGQPWVLRAAGGGVWDDGPHGVASWAPSGHAGPGRAAVQILHPLSGCGAGAGGVPMAGLREGPRLRAHAWAPARPAPQQRCGTAGRTRGAGSLGPAGTRTLLRVWAAAPRREGRSPQTRGSSAISICPPGRPRSGGVNLRARLPPTCGSVPPQLPRRARWGRQTLVPAEGPRPAVVTPLGRGEARFPQGGAGQPQRGAGVAGGPPTRGWVPGGVAATGARPSVRGPAWTTHKQCRVACEDRLRPRVLRGMSRWAGGCQEASGGKDSHGAGAEEWAVRTVWTGAWQVGHSPGH